jgi:hypothetical protein
MTLCFFDNNLSPTSPVSLMNQLLQISTAGNDYNRAAGAVDVERFT